MAASAGDDLVFPVGAARLTNTNNFADDTTFNSLTFTGGDYNVQETATGANTIQLSHGVLGDPTAGGATFFRPGLTLLSSQTISTIGTVNFVELGPISLNGSVLTANTNAANINLSGSISGNGSIIKTGTQILFFSRTRQRLYGTDICQCRHSRCRR